MPFKINLEIKEEHKDNTIAQLKAKVAELESQLQMYTGQYVTSGFSWTPTIPYPTITPSTGTGISINTTPYTVTSTSTTDYGTYKVGYDPYLNVSKSVRQASLGNIYISKTKTTTAF